MTQVHPSSIPDSTLDHYVQLARDRSARGNATRRDWQRIADVNPDIAYRELRDFLRRASVTEANMVSPYAGQSRKPGAVLGFIVGALLMMVLWYVLPYARENWMEMSIWRDIATGTQFLSALLIPVGMLVGVRWAGKRNPDRSGSSAAPSLPKDASFEDLLAIFETTQNVGRARVY